MDTNGAGDAFVGGEKTELISLKHFAEKLVFFYVLLWDGINVF